MNVSFDPQQDRLLLRVSTSEAQEFQFWLTRRMVVRIWPRLVTVLQAAPLAAKTALGTAPLEFRHAAAVQQADFATPYAVAGKAPVLAAEPMLVSQFSLAETAAGRYQMMLAGQAGASVNVTLAADLLHGLVKLVQDATRSAEWGVTLELPAAVMASTAIN